MIYIGESLEAYLDIAQKDRWETTAIVSEGIDRENSDLLIISQQDLNKYKSLSQKKGLSSYLRGFEQFKPFPFLLHFEGERVLLGRTVSENMNELKRFRFDEKFSSEKKMKLLESTFGKIFWNSTAFCANFLNQPFFFANKNQLLKEYKDTYCQNNGTYIKGEVVEISSAKPRSIVFDSIWGKCQVADLRVDYFSRLKGKKVFHEAEVDFYYEKVTLSFKIEEKFLLIPQIYIDLFLNNQWIPFSFVNLQGSDLIVDVYIQSNHTLKRDYLKKMAIALFEQINQELKIPYKAEMSMKFEHQILFSPEIENSLRPNKHFKRIEIN